MSNENCYASYLAKIRAYNQAKSSPCDTTPSPPCSQPETYHLPPPVVTYKLMCQTQMKNKQVVHLDTFSKSPSTLLCELPITTMNTNHRLRYIRVKLSAIIIDVSPDIAGRLYMAFDDEQGGMYNVCHEYTTSEPDKFSGVVQVEYYIPVQANTTRVVKLYATSNSSTCFISSNQGVYSNVFPVGPSYLTVEDVGVV